MSVRSTSPHPASRAQSSTPASKPVGTDGKLWLLITGMVELDPDHTPLVLGILNVTTTGVVSPVSPVRRPTSESDPADGHHLGIRYGGRHPWLMFIDTDAVRVYRRK